MRAAEVLVAHHRELLGLLDDLEHDPGRHDVLARLVHELAVHTQIEDELFYPAVVEVSPLLSVAHAEHRQIDEQLAGLLRADRRGREPEVRAQARLLRSTLRHHIDEEEQGMLPHAEALGPARLEELGAQLAARREQLDRSRLQALRSWLRREVLRHTP